MYASGISKQNFEQIYNRTIKPTEDEVKKNIEKHNLEDKKFDTFKELVKQLGELITSLSPTKKYSFFTQPSVTSNDSTIAEATVTDAEKALSGSFNITIKNLAAYHKVKSNAFESHTEPLNSSDMLTNTFAGGTFIINGKSVQVSPVDSLENICGKIKSTEVASASILGSGENTLLSIESLKSGMIHSLQLLDLDGTVLTLLGILRNITNPTPTYTWRAIVPNAVDGVTPNQVTSIGFESSSKTIAQMLNLTSTYANNVSLFGGQISVDLSVDNLNSLALKINNLNISSLKAKVVQRDQVYRLQVIGDPASNPQFVDADNLLQLLGLVQHNINTVASPSVTSCYVTPKDAFFDLDGILMRSSDNNVITGRSGLSINLKKDGLDANGHNFSTQITITQDAEESCKQMDEIIKKWSEINKFISQHSKFNAIAENSRYLRDKQTKQEESEESFFAYDSDVSLIKNDISRAIQGMNFLGVEEKNGIISLDKQKYKTAIKNNVQSVYEKLILKKSPDGAIRYITCSEKTKSSDLLGYSVYIAQLPTLTQFTAAVAKIDLNMDVNTQAEVLTFSGKVFGENKAYTLNIDIGDNLSTIVSKINALAIVNTALTASVDGNKKLFLIGKDNHGANGNFSVVSNLNAAIDNSGVGIAGEGVLTLGVDIQGIINGETATGAGRVLTVNDNNNADMEQRAAGLSLAYRGTTIGAQPNFVFIKGTLEQFLDTMTRSISAKGIIGLKMKTTEDKLRSDKNTYAEAIDKIKEDSEKLKREVDNNNRLAAEGEIQAEKQAQMINNLRMLRR